MEDRSLITWDGLVVHKSPGAFQETVAHPAADFLAIPPTAKRKRNSALFNIYGGG